MPELNKFELINKALLADLKPILGKMLVEFIMRADETGFSHVGAERLCKVRGIKHTKNFPWHELHDSMSHVLTIKLGRDLTVKEIKHIESTGKTVYGDKNYFWIKPAAIMALEDFAVTKSVKPKAADRAKAKTPASAGSKTPASADPSTLQVQTKTPASAGCNSSNQTLQDNSSSKSSNTTADAAVVPIRKDEGMSYEYLGSLNVEDFADLSLTMEAANLDYLANSEGVYRSSNSKKEAVLPNVDSRDAAVYGCGYQGSNYGHHVANHLRLGNPSPATAAKYCPIKEPVSHG